MATHQHLYGSCACERNQYAIAIPHSLVQDHSTATSSNLAHVFFDNSRANRKSSPILFSDENSQAQKDESLTYTLPGRTQAAPLTAWLRIPLAWYHSNTRAFYPDESHASIRRTFYTPLTSASASLSAATSTGLETNSNNSVKQIRKQFCGYCGTHLNAWQEDDDRGQWMDVTLGSLWGESLGVLEGLGWLDDTESSSNGSGCEEEEEEQAASSRRGELRQSAARSMSNRGLPFFEKMVEDSRLGRIKRRSGAHVGADGSSVEWHVVELDGEEGGDDALMDDRVVSAETGNGNKRLKLGD
jgi:hypothetical protein